MFFPFFPWTLNMTNLFWGKNKNLNKANPFQLVCVNKLISFIGKCRKKNTMTIRFKPMNCCDRNVHLCNGKVRGKRVRTPFIFLCFIISKASNLRIKKRAHAIVSLQIKLNHNLWEKILNSLFLCCFIAFPEDSFATIGGTLLAPDPERLSISNSNRNVIPNIAWS